MAIKQISDVAASVKRPFRLSDLQDVWQGLNNILAAFDEGFDETPRIISGFVSEGGLAYSGTLAFRGQLYYNSGILELGTDWYVDYRDTDNRVFADDGTYAFSREYIVTQIPSPTSTHIGAPGDTELTEWKAYSIPARSITFTKLANDSVRTATVQNEAITAAKLSRALAPCIIHPTEVLTIPPGTTGSVRIPDLLTYDATNGRWLCKPVELPSGITSFSFSAFDLHLQPNFSTLPHIVPIVLNQGSNSSPALVVRVIGKLQRDWYLGQGPFATSELTLPEGVDSRVVGTLIKTDAGYVATSLNRVATDTYV